MQMNATRRRGVVTPIGKLFVCLVALMCLAQPAAAASGALLTPVRCAMYTGTSGSTQGERKLTSPAIRAAGMDTSCIA